MKRFIPIALIALIALCSATMTTAALAQDPGVSPGDPGRRGNPVDGFMKQLDKDGDGKVSAEEFLAPQKAAFKRTDADGDGFVSRDEATAAFEEMRKKREERMKQMQKQMQQQTPPPAK